MVVVVVVVVAAAAMMMTVAMTVIVATAAAMVGVPLLLSRTREFRGRPFAIAKYMTAHHIGLVGCLVFKQHLAEYHT